MNWKELKAKIDAKVKDDETIWYININLQDSEELTFRRRRFGVGVDN